MQSEASNRFGWPTAILVSVMMVGAASFWLLSQGMLGQGVAIVVIPACFLGATAAVVIIAIRHQRRHDDVTKGRTHGEHTPRS